MSTLLTAGPTPLTIFAPHIETKVTDGIIPLKTTEYHHGADYLTPDIGVF